MNDKRITNEKQSCALLLLLDEKQGLEGAQLVYGALKLIAGEPYLLNSNGAMIALPRSCLERLADTPEERKKLFMGCPQFVVSSKDEALALSAVLETDDGWSVCYPATNHIQ